MSEVTHHHKKSKKKREREAEDVVNTEGEPEKKRKKKHRKDKEKEERDVEDLVGGYEEKEELHEQDDSKEKKKKKKKDKKEKKKDKRKVSLDEGATAAEASTSSVGGKHEVGHSDMLNDEGVAIMKGPDSQARDGSSKAPKAASKHKKKVSFAQLNNDDILRAINTLDVSRLPSDGLSLDAGDPYADLLASAGFDDEPTPGAAPPKAKTIKTYSKKDSKPTKTTSSTAPKVKSKVAGSSKQLLGNGTKSGHAELLASKWLSSAQLKELAETDGLVYKQGKFSKAEEEALSEAIGKYRDNCAMTEDQITDLILSKSKQDIHNQFWYELASVVPGRPLFSVYHHVQRARNPLKHQGKWSTEEDVDLTQAVKNFGHSWQKVSEHVGRSAADCRDRWRNHLADRKDKRTGKWTKEEEDELTRIVLEMKGDTYQDIDSDIFWGEVSKRMGGKRGRQQCRIKWVDSLSSTVKVGGDAPRWTKHDGHILVQRVAALNVGDDSEIDWKRIPNESWNLFSAHALQRRFRTMKQAIKGHEEMPFSEIMEILLQKHPEVPEIVVESSKWKARKFQVIPKSADMIESDDE